MGIDISIVINVDTRPERENNEQMFSGVVNRDFLVDGVLNKKKAFEDFSHEIIVFVDEHEPIEEKTLSYMREVCDTLIIRKHNKKFEETDDCAYFNDLNYLNALFCARGKYIFHFDGDEAIFVRSKEEIEKQIELLEKYDYVSYPSYYSPNPVVDESFGNKFWVSTRYFCCKRETINFSEVLKCQTDYDYWKGKYPVPRLCHWTEHILSSISHHTGNGVFYPPFDMDNIIIFTWENYHKYTLQRLNNQTFDEVKDWVMYNGGIFYPNNLHIK